MKKNLRSAILLLGLSATTVAARVPCEREVDCAFAELDVNVRHTVEGFLQRDCGIGDTWMMHLQEVVEVREEASRYLQAVQAQGPPRQVLTEIEKGLKKTWEAMQAYLATDYAHKGGQDVYEMMASITKEDYFENQLGSVDVGYRERAERALRSIQSGACFGRLPTIVGTPGDDHITGTLGDDVIVGLGGNDVIVGMGGNDIVCGGSGDDQVTTDAGKDLISGGDGRDTIASGAGSDRVLGGNRDDQIDGGDDGDRLKGGRGQDVIVGGPGDDTLIGGAGIDTLDGGPDSDRCIGGENTSSCP